MRRTSIASLLLISLIPACTGTSELRTESRRSGVRELHERELWGGATATATAVSWDITKFLQENGTWLAALLGGPTLAGAGYMLHRSGRKSAEKKSLLADATAHRDNMMRKAMEKTRFPL